ncbi:MAG: alpha/beta fold hydrolase [Burkholderiales bacterium]|jgi:hypothetical protein|nr:alpha/beta fold hydrolase [Burkholderiales bacterium]
MVVYLHGFNSSPASVKARQLERALAARGRGPAFACPALSSHPTEAAAQIAALCDPVDATQLVLVGSSLGGFYATWYAQQRGCRAVLINPAITPHDGLRAWLGPQTNLYTGEAWVLEPRHLDAMAALATPRITQPQRYLLMVTTGDALLPWEIAVRHYAGAQQVVIEGSDHGFESFEQHLAPVFAFIDGAKVSGKFVASPSSVSPAPRVPAADAPVPRA